ncbi:MAG: adenylate/guanylate cyclase domain-containing protein, partial [Acidimicrobiales bacterium]
VGSSDEGADAALDFTEAMVASARSRAAEVDASVTVHIGLSTGPVATGVLDSGSLTFGAWGEPVRRALAIAALARSDELLLDMTTADALDRSRFALEPAQDIVSLDGASLPLMASPLSAPTAAGWAADAGPSPG